MAQSRPLRPFLSDSQAVAWTAAALRWTGPERTWRTKPGWGQAFVSLCALFVGWRPRRAGRSRQHQTRKPAPPVPAAFQPSPEANKTDWLRPDLAAAAMTSPRFHPTSALAARRDFPWARESHGRSHPSRSRAYNSGKTPRLAAGWNECPPRRTRPESNQVSNQEASPRNTSARRTTRPAAKKCEKNKKSSEYIYHFL